MFFHNNDSDNDDMMMQGITLDLTGLQDYITCTTNKLNHPDITDFSPAQNGEFYADPETGDDQYEDGWGSCYQVGNTQHLDSINKTSNTINILHYSLNLFSECTQGRGKCSFGELEGFRKLDGG